MPLFKQSLDVPPSPRAKHSAVREGDTIRALGEVRSVLARLAQFLAPYVPKILTDGEGKRWGVLAFEAGESATPPLTGFNGFELVPFLDGATQKVKVMYSTLAAEAPTTPTPESDFSYLFTPSGTQIVYGKIVINSTTGEVTSRTLHAAASVPADTDTDFHVEIGSMTANGSDPATVANARFGPIDAQICRNWYAAEAPYFGVNWS